MREWFGNERFWRAYDVDRSRVRNEWILLRGNRARRYKFNFTVYSGQKLKDMLRETGFVEVRLCGDLDGQPYGPHSPGLVAVARKPRNKP